MVTFVTPLPTPPSRQDPVNFSARGDEFLGALPQFQTELNSLGVDVEGVLSDTQGVLVQTQGVLVQTQTVRDETLTIKQDTDLIKSEVLQLKSEVGVKVTEAEGFASLAGNYADSAAVSAAAAQSAAGLPTLVGKAGKGLRVTTDELGVEWADISGTSPVSGAIYYYGNDPLLEHAGGRWQRVDAVVPYSPELHELPAIPAAAWQFVRQAVSGSVGNFTSGMQDGVSWLAFGPSGIYRSIDRVTWELVSTVLPGGYGRLAGDGVRGIHCAISGNGPSLYRSADNMQSWSSVSVFGGNTINDICCSGSIFIAVGATGRIASSPTGQTWTDRGPGTPGDFRRCVWTGEFFIAYRANGEVWKSSDGISWSVSAAGVGTAFAEICTFGGVTYLASSSQISYSSDGVSWVTKSHPAVSVKGVSHAGGKLVLLAASSPSKIYSSGDSGDSWLEEQYLYSPLLNFIAGRRDEDVSLLLGASGFIGDISSFTSPATIRFSQASNIGNFNLYARTK